MLHLESQKAGHHLTTEQQGLIPSERTSRNPATLSMWVIQISGNSYTLPAVMEVGTLNFETIKHCPVD